MPTPLHEPTHPQPLQGGEQCRTRPPCCSPPWRGQGWVQGINADRASYRDAYKTTAIFLEWAEKTHDKQLVHKLNRAMRDGVFNMEIFKTNTGLSIDDLWKQFTDTVRERH